MADNFEVSVGGNIEGLKKAFNEGAAAAKTFESSALKSAVGIEKAFEGVNFAKSISTLEGQLRNFEQGVKRSTNVESIGRLNRAIDETKARLLAINKVANGAGLNKFTAGSNQAAFALQNFGRVAQDAPFGFMGIQNNLNPLLESFAALRKESGSNKEAFKALAGSLMGVGGLGLALSVVSSAVLFYQQYQQKANKATKEAKASIDDYISSLNDISEARLKGTQSAQSELIVLKLLYDRTQNLTLSQQERQKAVDQLQEKYPAYFKNIKDEAILAGNAEKAYRELSSAILATSRARAAIALIDQNSSRQLTDVQRLRDIERKQNDARYKAAVLEKRVVDENLLAKQEANILTSDQRKTLNEYLSLQAESIRYDKEMNSLKTDFNVLQNRNLDLIKYTNDQVNKGGLLEGGVGDLDVKPKLNGESRADLLRELEELRAELLIKYSGIAIDLSSQPGELIKKALKDSKRDIAKDLTSGEPLIPIANLFGKDKPATVGAELYTPFEILRDEIQFDLLPAIGDSFNNFFENILEKGEFSFKALGQSIKKTFASVLANEATQGLLNALGQKGSKAEGNGGGLIPAIAGLFGKAKPAAVASTGASVAGKGAGLLGGISPAALAVGGAVIAGTLINSIVEGINKKKGLPNLYGPDGSSFIGESRSRGNDLLQTWYRTEKRKGR